MAIDRYPERLPIDERLVIDEHRILVAFEGAMERAEVEEILEAVGLQLEGDGGADGSRDEDDERGTVRGGPNTGTEIHHTADRFWARSREPITEDRLEKVQGHDAVGWIAPVYRREDVQGLRGHVGVLPNVLLVRYRDDASGEEIRRVEEAHDLRNDEERSKFLSQFTYYRLSDDDLARGVLAYEKRERLLDEFDVVESVRFERLPLVSPVAFVPNDTFFANQWDMDQIDAPDGWDLETGDGSVVIGILDEGCDMDHDDLVFDGPGFNPGTNGDGEAIGSHGTAVAGIAAGSIDNNEGVSGVAGGCQIHSVAIPWTWSEVDVAAAINEAATVANVDVINMSFGTNGWDETVIDPEIENAHDNHDVVLCAATHNHDSEDITYPATHPDVIAVGASDQNDERKRPASPDGENWGSNWGPEIDVVAPGVMCWTTDREADAGYNSNGGGSISMAGVNYPSSGSEDGDYFSVFNGTSAATPHVAGLAGLLRSLDASLSNVEIRSIIERTCDKVSTGTYTYATEPGKPNGTWNEEVGYGRINVRSALEEVLSVELTTNPVVFMNVPEGYTTNAAAVFEVRAPFPVDLEITGGPTKLSGSGEFLTFDPPGTATTAGPTGGGTVQANVFVFFEAGASGSTATGTVTIECPQTNGTWEIDLTGHSVEKEDAGVVLVLDHSGSMAWSSGVEDATGTTLSRIQLLQESVEPLLSLLENDDGVGAVGFSDDATVLEGLADAGLHVHPAHRVLTEDEIDALGPGGKTSIAEGILAGDGLFDDPTAPDYTHESLVVFTDGHDNPAPGRRSLTDPDVQNAIDERVFAIGMGTPTQLQPTTLQSIVDGSGGYFQFTGDFTADDIYRLRKYFLQVLASATNADIVVDPERRIRPGDEHRIPFDLTEADVGSDVILLTPRWRGLLEFAVETPDGDVIDPGVASSIPGVEHVTDEATAFYRLQLPTLTGNSADHGGRWHAVVSVDEGQLKEFVAEHGLDRREMAELEAVGVSYDLSVHARSNVRLRTTLSQDSMEPGATLSLRAVLTEYGLPVEDRATARAELTRPDGTVTTLELSEVEPGVFERSVAGTHPGVYRFHVRTEGRTVAGRPFTREDVRTAGLWNGGDTPQPGRDSTGPDERLCRLFECVLDGGFEKFFEAHGIDSERLRECVKRYCHPGSVRPKDERERPPVRRAEVDRLLRNPRTADIVRSLSEMTLEERRERRSRE